MKGFVYVLKNNEGRIYIGSTDNLVRRLAHHKYGGTYTTRRMQNIHPVLTQEYATLQEARKVELKLKKFKRRDFVEKIIKEGHIKIEP